MKKHERIRELRKSLELTQAFVAEYLEMNRSSYNKLENGVRELKAEELEKLSKVFGVSTDYIFEGDKEITRSEYFQRSFESLSPEDQEEIINAIKFKKRLRNKLNDKK